MIWTPNEMPIPRSIIDTAARQAWCTTFGRLAVDDAFLFAVGCTAGDKFEYSKAGDSSAWHIATNIKTVSIPANAKVYALKLKESDDI